MSSEPELREIEKKVWVSFVILGAVGLILLSLAISAAA
jgi:hypothetical protein